MANITIYEIAKEAGCSASTVSRVLNGYPYVKTEDYRKQELYTERNRPQPCNTIDTPHRHPPLRHQDYAAHRWYLLYRERAFKAGLLMHNLQHRLLI